MSKPQAFKARPAITRIKTVWVTEKTQPFEEDFDVLDKLGEPGQFGTAYRVKRKADGRSFAAKEVLKARLYQTDRDATRRQAILWAMKGEIDIMKRLKHDYIVSMESVYEDKHRLHIVMEECKGGELFDRIRQRGQYTENDAATIITMILRALYYMHEMHRVVHCDLKPDNILFVTKEENSPIKIIDFGMSKVLPRLKTLRELCGTPYYTAPEIIRGDYAHEADMWSVGVIMFVMLFGYPPFYVDAKLYGKKEAEAIYQKIQEGFTPEVLKGYGPWFPKKIPVSDAARDLMAHLMDSDKAKRFSAKEALQHPWIKQGGADKNPLTKEILVEFAKFTNNCNFKLAVITLFKKQFQQMRPAHFQNLQEVFKKLDKDGDGLIDYSEFEAGMLTMNGVKLSQDQIREMFSELDVKEAGKIGFQELLNAAVHDYLVSGDERLYQAFRDLDEDEDGVIDTEELKLKLREADPYGQYAEFLKIINDTNLDKNGKIDYEEFLRALHPNFNEIPHWFWQVQKGKDDQKDDI